MPYDELCKDVDALWASNDVCDEVGHAKAMQKIVSSILTAHGVLRHNQIDAITAAKNAEILKLEQKAAMDIQQIKDKSPRPIEERRSFLREVQRLSAEVTGSGSLV